MIGQDFEKIHFDIWGFHFLEPNALIGDLILFSCAMYFAQRLQKIKTIDPFFQKWQRYYLAFGITFLFGGLGHFLFYYWGILGKYPSWILGMLTSYLLCVAQVSLWQNERQKKILNNLALTLLLTGVIVETYLFNVLDLSIDQSKGLVVPAAMSAIGMAFALFYLGTRYQQLYHTDFKYFWYAGLVLLPSTVILSLKINLAPWFDRNDFSHVLLLLSLILYWQGIQGFKKTK